MTARTPARIGLTRAWLALAVFALVCGAVFAAGVAASRTPGVGGLVGLGAGFAPALTLHVTLATLVWLLGVAAAAWVAQPPGRAAGRPFARRLGWANWGLAVAGVSAVLASGVAAALGLPGAGPAVLSNYVPVIDHPVFLGGLAAYVAAVLFTGTHALWRSLRARRRGRPGAGPVRWTPWRAAALAAVVPLWAALATLALQWHAHGGRDGLAQAAESLFWGPGHLLQFSHVLIAMAGWLWLLRARVRPAPAIAVAIAITAVPALAGPVLAIVPGLDEHGVRAAFTDLMRGFSWPGPALLVLHAASLAWREWRARRAGRTQRRCAREPWRASELAAIASIALFALGVGVALLIRGDTTMVPAHYHGTVGAATLAAIAIVIRVFTPAGHRQARRWRIVAMYASGFVLLVAGLAIAGSQRLPRKVPVAGASDSGDVALAGLVTMAIGAALAVAAIAWLGGGVARALIDRRRRRGPVSSAAPAARARVHGDPRRHLLAATVAGVLALGTVIHWTSAHDAGDAAHARAPTGDDELRERFRQGVWMLHAKRFEHALAAFHRVLAIRPDMPEGHVNMGYALLGLGRHREARAFFESAIDLRPEQLNAYYGLATALEAVGDVRGAIGAMRTYTHLTRDDDPYLRRARAALWEWENARGARGPRQ